MNSNILIENCPYIPDNEYILRRVCLEDSQELFEILSDEEVIAYYNSPIHKTLEDSRKFIRDIMKGYKHQFSMIWGVTRKDEEKLIGICGYHSWSKFNNRAQILYALSRKHWGNGIMSKVLGPVIEFGFNELNLNRIEAVIVPDNINSIKLVSRQNFKQEGKLREYGFVRDTLDDYMIYSLLKKEYLTN